MVFFLIGAPLIEKLNEQQTLSLINKTVGNCAEQYLNEGQRFKLGNIDTLLYNIELMQKMETQFEGFLRKIERQYLETTDEQSTNFKIETPDSNMEIPQYLKKFRWQDAKFPRNQPLNELVSSLKKRVDKIDEAFRKKTHEYQEEKNKFQSLSSKEGNLYVKDLADIFTPAVVKDEDFEYTEHINTVIAVVPKNKEQLFKDRYNSISDNVVPYSAKKFIFEDKETFLYRVFVYRSEYNPEVVARLQREKDEAEQRKLDEESRKERERNAKTDEEKKQIEKERQQAEEKRLLQLKNRKPYKAPTEQFTASMREELGITIREFKYNKNFYENRETQRRSAQTKSEQEKKLLTELCRTSFSELYVIYMHLKYLRMVVDIAARFGRDNVLTAIVHPPSGKEKKVVNELTNIYCEPNQKGFYGDKDEIEDTEDFYPFVYIPISHI